MDTPDHAFWTYVLFHRRDWWAKAVAASILPDLPFIISSAYFFSRYEVSMNVWIQAFENPWVKPIGFFTHSLVISSLGLTVVFFLQRKSVYPYFYGWIFHILTDIITHVSDAQPVFWPLSEKRFSGFVSYWEPRYYSREFALVNLTLESLFALYFLLTKNHHLSGTHPAARAVLFGFMSLYILGSGILFFRHGYSSAEALTLHFVAGILLLLVAVNAYPFKGNYPQ